MFGSERANIVLPKKRRKWLQSTLV